MAIIDIVLLAIVGIFVLFGFYFGLIHTAGSLLGTFIGIGVAVYALDPIYGKIGFLFGSLGEGVAKVIIFILAFLIISRIVGVIFWALDKFYNLFSFIPFTKSINKLLGALFGFIEGVVIVGVAVYFASLYLPAGEFKEMLELSMMGEYLINTLGVILAFLPEWMNPIIEIEL
jgi:membrane protein required for colicin V production